ncbi:MAG: PAS domain S-box protein [Sulfurimonas sp.]|nr:PAS domain S-box protein [Sulfurimonas sp.]
MQTDIFEITFEKAAIGIAHVDATGKWIRVNEHLCNFLGYEREELFKLTFQEITYLDDLAYDLDHAKKLHDGESDSFSIEKRYIRKDGTLIWANLSASAVRDEHGKLLYFISIIADINARKELEEKLKMAEITINTAGDGLYWIDLDANIVHVNEAACNMLGYKHEELLCMSVPQIDPPMDTMHWNALVKRLQNGEVIQLESQHKKKDGQLLAVGITGNYFVLDHKEYIFASVRDLTESKKVLHQLEQSNSNYKESNRNLRKAEQLAKLGNWTLDMVSKKLQWTDEIFNIFEIDKNLFEATYEAFLNAIHPDDRQMVHDAYTNSLITQENYKIIHRLLMSDGRIKYVIEQCETKFDSDGNPLYSIGTVQDITDIKLTELELENAKKRAQNYLDIVDVMVLVVDEHNSVQMLNGRGCEILGYSFHEVVGKNWVENFLPKCIENEMNDLVDKLKISDTSAFCHENAILTRSGAERMIAWHNTPLFDEVTGKYLGILCSGEDVTNIREAQKQLVESEQFYRTIVSSIDEAIFILENNIIIDCNPKALALFEMTKAELVGSNMLHTQHTLECNIETFDTYLKNAYAGKTTRIQCTLILNNNLKYSKVLEITLANYGNETEKLIMLASDITQKLEEEKFFKLHTRQAQMGEMISLIAHQWRQPLAIINAIASQLRLKEMLKDEENSDLVEYLIKIEQQSLHLSQTISDYRDFFRPDKPLESISLSELINHSLDLIDHALKSKGIDVQITVHIFAKVAIYKNEMIQVLIMLIKNAFDAFDDNNISHKQIGIEITQDDLYGIIIIKDNAGGISKDVISKIFVPYFTTKSYSHGTGLGLYMSKIIIEDHCNGLLEVSSKEDTTTITIKLPLKNKLAYISV